ncbi:glutathione S-transferase [Mycena latifolia]|nr:glutathione S-transferase [Mycena latifolia]
MAILKLYGYEKASCTRRVATVLHELRIPFELIHVDWSKGEHKSAEFLEKQPFGQIPYIYPQSGLIPAEPKANALFEQAASVEMANFDPSASKAELEILKMCAVIDEQLQILDKKLEAYDAILLKQRYLAGSTLTLADLFHLPYGPMVASGENDVMTRRPNVARWYNELISRPSWLAYVDGVKTTTAY